nr:glycosyl hydrolase 53 family protein [Pectobacterium colocasium]
MVAAAQRAKAMGMRVMVDFHYSDVFADPGHQIKPAAWANYNLSQLTTAVYNHTYEVMGALISAGVTPEWVQVGNEMNPGNFTTGRQYQSVCQFNAATECGL